MILIVEDDENDATLLTRALRRGTPGAMLRLVKDGLEALLYLRGAEEFSQREKYPFPNLIFLDLKMPRMSGLELLAWIQDKPQMRSVPTIVISGSELACDIQDAYRLGANTYMVKPVEPDRLSALIKAALHSSPVKSERSR